MIRLLHTADWHAGKVLYRRDRTPELKHAMEQMLTMIKEDQVDVILICGDVFDTYNPSARARHAVYQFFLELHALNIPAIVLSGNHDSSNMFDSIKGILKLANVHIFDKPQQDCVFTLNIKGVDLNIANLPYPSNHKLAQLIDNEKGFAQQLQNYAEMTGVIFDMIDQQLNQLSGINIMCSHLMVSGAVPSQSERELSVQDVYAVLPQRFPASAQYVALGHIHKRQQMKDSAVPVWYSGSPIKMDFGETKDIKGVNLVDLEVGSIAKVEFRELTPLKDLKEYRIDLDQLDKTLEACKAFDGYLKLRVKINGPQPGLADQIRDQLGTKLLNLQLLMDVSEEQQVRSQVEIQKPLEVYEAYYDYRERELDSRVKTAFLELMERVEA